MLPSAMPSAVSSKTNPPPTNTPPPTPPRQRCALEACTHPLREPDKYQFHSGLCQQLQKFIDNIEKLCIEVDDEAANALYAEAVLAIDSIVQVDYKRRAIWRRSKSNGR